MENKIDMKYTIIRQELSHRGGGIEIALDNFGFEDEKMTAYQNYLGGGMLGSIANDCTIRDWRDDETLQEVANELSQYFGTLTNPEADWNETQRMPLSAY